MEKKTDKFRGEYYRYYTGHEWKDPGNYDMCLDSSRLGFEKCLAVMKAYAKIRFPKVDLLKEI